MSKSFTPGPWIVKEGVVCTAKGQELLERWDGDYHYQIPATERDANIQLAASAPDLLAACKEALRIIELRHGDERDLSFKLRQAISYARGDYHD